MNLNDENICSICLDTLNNSNIKNNSNTLINKIFKKKKQNVQYVNLLNNENNDYQSEIILPHQINNISNSNSNSNYNYEILICGHKFHRDCFLQWYEINNTCPQCRSIIPYYFTIYFKKNF